MDVLVVAARSAPGVERVCASLAARGARTHRFDGDAFPSRARVSVHHVPRSPQEARARIDALEVDRFDALWLRSVGFGRGAPRAIEPAWWRLGCEAATVVARAAMARVRGFTMDPYWVIQRADDKPLQLALAAELGLETPPTLLTNDPEEVRAFAREHGPLVTKLPTTSSYVVPDGSEDEDGTKLYTSLLDERDLEALDGLSACPMIFQPALPKALELRVTVVGERVFAAALRTSRPSIDWRRDPDDVELSRYELPEETRRGVLALVAGLGLHYGAVDLVVTPDGRHVLLEVNASGEFEAFEAILGFPIADAIADLLVGRAPRHAG